MPLRRRQVAPLSALEREDRYDKNGYVAGLKPDQQYLSALLQETYQEHDRQRTLDRHIADLLEDKHDLGLPQIGLESEEIRGGWAMELIYRIRQWWPNAPTIRVPSSPAVGDEPERFANDLEAGLNALLDAQSDARQGPGGPFFDQIKSDVISWGRGYASLLPYPSAWADYPTPPPDKALNDPEIAGAYNKRVNQYSKGRMPPLQLSALPPRTVLPKFDDQGLAEVFWTSGERLGVVMARAKARGAELPRALSWRSERPERQSQPVTVVHYANRRYCAEMCGTPRSWPPAGENPDWLEDAELIGEPYEHWVERIPVVYFPGMTTPLGELHNQTVSAVYQLRHIITMIDRLSSMKATIVRTWAWPTPVLKTSLASAQLIKPDDFGRPSPVEISPGLMLTLWPDEDVSFLSYQGSGPETNEVLTLLRQQFDRLGLPPVESGSGDLSSYAAAQMRANARGKWTAIHTGLVTGWRDLARLEIEYLKQLPSDVYVPVAAENVWPGMGSTVNERPGGKSAYYWSFSPEKLRKRRYEVLTVLEADKSLDMVANTQAALALLQAGVTKKRVFENVLGIENTSEERLQKMLEDLQSSDAYRQAIFGDALREGRIQVEQAQTGGEMTLDELSNYSLGQVQAMAQAGLISQPLFQQYMAMQSQNVMAGQVGGAGAMGTPPPMLPAGPAMAPGGSAAATPITGAPTAGMVLPTGPMGPTGGMPSPALMAPPAPVRNILSRGRAAGQSRAPASNEAY